MKPYFLLLVFLMVSCRAEPEIIDNGNPGSIRFIVYHDQNRNARLDSGEPALQDQVAIAQDISCPAQNPDLFNRKETDINGEAIFTDLTPGKYCAMYMGGKGLTTKITVDVYLSSDQEALISYGISQP